MSVPADASPPLAGELTTRQFATWCDKRGVRPIVLAYGGAWVAEVWIVRPESRPTKITTQAPDLQDALTTLMARVDGAR